MHGKEGGKRAQILAIGLLIAASLYLTWSLVALSRDVRALISLKAHPRRRHVVKPLDSYSFIGADHPKRLPIEEKLVKLRVEESVHYDILAPEAASEWLWTATVGDGHIRLGKEERMFAVAMSHELHCLRGIREVIENGWDMIGESRQHHILHCFNYLRQWTLCAADATLEPGDFTQRNFTAQRVGATHTCVDWLPTYEMMKDKWLEWDHFRIDHGIPWHDEVT
ncbi:hypothetical protein CPB84DRAFT_1776311 [Gymnopilus junonius]|uniref:Uncharacterized protein n=1 Tax=Gymnopilus junonius TaxID=109634 RepID=A0A9P5TNY0_GYMJU|nr:hypothetical protein CPB84DRAFT_1776311 [Gymnopilus junonius]